MPFTSPYPDVDVPDVSVFDYVFGDLAEADAARVALVDTGSDEKFSYRHLIDSASALSGALVGRGIGLGDVVGVLAPNSSMFAIAFYGTLRAGATVTTVNVLSTANDIANQLTDAHAKMLITVTPLAAQAAEAAAAVGLSDGRLVILDGPGESTTGHPNLDDLLRSREAPPHLSIEPASHLAVLPYSSGTTGKPKGVMLTHRNLVANIAQMRPVQNVCPDDRLLAVMPFFHSYGLTVLLGAGLHARARLVIMPRFDLTEFLEAVQRHRCTHVFIAPPVAVALAKHPMVDCRYSPRSITCTGSAWVWARAGTAQPAASTISIVLDAGWVPRRRPMSTPIPMRCTLPTCRPVSTSAGASPLSPANS